MSVLYLMLMSLLPAAHLLYKSRRQAMQRFCRRMAWQGSMRRMYGLMVTLWLLVFHFYYLQLLGDQYEVLLSSLLCFSLLNRMWFERVMRTLQTRRMAVVTMTAVLALIFVPYGFTTGVTLGMLLTAAMYYPARAVTTRSEWILERYYEWR